MENLLLAVTLVSLALAAVTSLLAWRVTREERVRSAARMAALAAELQGAHHAAPAFAEAATGGVDTVAPEGTVLFGAPNPATSRFRLVAVLAAGALFVTTVIGALVGLSEPRAAGPDVRAAAGQQTPAAAHTATEVPLELVALGHEREADRITVRGVVRNPAGGSALSELKAVVFLFDRSGGFITSSSAAIDAAAVAPGAERTFVVSLPAGPDVGRYRVSFRSADHVVAHIDKRS